MPTSAPNNEEQNTPLLTRADYKDLRKAENEKAKKTREQRKLYKKAEKDQKEAAAKKKKAVKKLKDEALRTLIWNYGSLGQDVFMHYWNGAREELARGTNIEKSWKEALQTAADEDAEYREDMLFHLEKSLEYLEESKDKELAEEHEIMLEARSLFEEDEIEAYKDPRRRENMYYRRALSRQKEMMVDLTEATYDETVRNMESSCDYRKGVFAESIAADIETTLKEMSAERNLDRLWMIERKKATCAFYAARRAICAPLMGGAAAITAPFIFSLKFVSLLDSTETAFRITEAEATPSEKLRENLIYKGIYGNNTCDNG